MLIINFFSFLHLINITKRARLFRPRDTPKSYSSTKFFSFYCFFFLFIIILETKKGKEKVPVPTQSKPPPVGESNSHSPLCRWGKYATGVQQQKTEKILCVRNHLQLIPFFIAILRHELLGRSAELLRFVWHFLRVVLQLIQLVATFNHQHVRSTDFILCRRRSSSQLLDVCVRTRN